MKSTNKGNDKNKDKDKTPSTVKVDDMETRKDPKGSGSGYAPIIIRKRIDKSTP